MCHEGTTAMMEYGPAPAPDPVAILDHLNRTLGPDNWSLAYREGPHGVVARLGIRLDRQEGDAWLFKEQGVAHPDDGLSLRETAFRQVALEVWGFVVEQGAWADAA